MKHIVTAGLSALFLAVTVVAERSPNIILIMADDVSWECFSCYGAEDYDTPNIDALAAKGVRFDHCYSQPICTPSRVKIMTGQYNFRNYTHFGYLNPNDRTFGHMMQEVGYQTAVAGKWQLNGLYHQAEGCADNTRPFKAGFDEYCLWQVTRQKQSPGGERFWSPPLEHNGKFLTREDNARKYGPDIMSDFVCDFITRNQNQPFFVYYPTVLVHSPFVPTPDTIGDAPRTHDANKKNKGSNKENFVAMVEYMDKLIGKIVRTVEEVGQLENTIIMFTADNGTGTGINSQWNGKRIQGGKGKTIDTGTHVPFVAYWKGHSPEGKAINDVIDFTDFYATIAEAAGITLSDVDPIDGRSFLPQLKGEKGNPRDWMLCNYQPYWGKFPGSQFIRNDEFKLYRDGRFYHVPKDLLEKQDLQQGQAGERCETARRKLGDAIETAAPAPPVKGGRQAKERPTYPDWKNIVNPND
ncbi:sulfatase-like hydrolase/transferase [Pontiellaceae bacterium B12227]|nr:sulfatase-like hydrolase/transferase [Pontiellaceae bacterium B12227]